MGADDFLVSACNAAVVDLIDAWPGWKQPVYLIEGPAGAGKTHLANVWRHRTGAVSLDGRTLSVAGLPELSLSNGIVFEDADRVDFNEQALFHLLNLSRERGFFMLLTARVPPARWKVALPDLISRLRALPAVRIGAPDDTLLGAVLLKHFSDRQLNVEPHVLQFLARRMVRSMDAVRELAAVLDQAALASGKKITRQFAGEILARFQSDEYRFSD